MPDTGLFGPHTLNNDQIDAHVDHSIGAYALGKKNDSGGLTVKYVGRSDDDLNSRLKCWVGDYAHFKYGHFDTVEKAFKHECKMFHDFSGLDNDIHPARPSDAKYGCPYCNALD